MPLVAERALSTAKLPSGLRDMSDEEIRVVFETLDLPLSPPSPAPAEQKTIYLFPVGGSSTPNDEAP